MTLAKALKQKNKLVKELQNLQSRLLAHNCYFAQNSIKFSSTTILEEITNKRTELLTLKTKIALANTNIQGKILEIGELKSFVNILKAMETKEGFQSERYSSEGPIEYKSQINEEQKIKLVEEVENQIESLQEEIDTFNHKTEI